MVIRTSKLIRILFVLDCLEGGGSQRAAVNIINAIDTSRFEVHLILINKKGELLRFLPEWLNIYNLNCRSAKFALFKIAKKIRELKPDLIFSTPTYISEVTYLALKFSKSTASFIARCPNFESVNIKNESFLTRMLIIKAYSGADRVIALTEAMKMDIVDNFGVSKDKVSVLPNMVNLAEVVKLSKEEISDEFFTGNESTALITAMGRLTKQKGFEFLLRAFAKLRKKVKCKLAIIGDGKLKSKLIAKADKLRIKDDVYFMGFKVNPYKYIAKSNVFVLSSLWEGFPNALIEAMACGVPVISSDCPSGPSEIITSGLNGVLVPPKNSNELNDALNRVLSSVDYRENLSKAGLERVADFESRKVVRKYEKLFLEEIK